MELPESRKSALIAEITEALRSYSGQETDITASDIVSAAGVTYNIALNFLDKLARQGILLKVKLPSKAVVFRDVDGTAGDKIREFITSLRA